MVVRFLSGILAVLGSSWLYNLKIDTFNVIWDVNKYCYYHIRCKVDIRWQGIKETLIRKSII